LFVKNTLSKDGTGHVFWHIERVRNNARLINKKEKGNWFIIDLAVLLHDVGDRKVIDKKEDDYTIAENASKLYLGVRSTHTKRVGGSDTYPTKFSLLLRLIPRLL